MKMTVLIDFDGTIVDVWERFHKVFSSLSQGNHLTLEEYIFEKRKIKKDELIAKKYNLILNDNYYAKKRILLEETQFLKYDKLLINRKKLFDFIDDYNAFILTKRRNRENYMKQLSILGLERLQKKSIVLEDEQLTKRKWVRENCNGDVIIIGDSYAEYDTGKLDNVKVFLVDTGLNDFSDVLIQKNYNRVNDLNNAIKIIRGEQK